MSTKCYFVHDILPNKTLRLQHRKEFLITEMKLCGKTTFLSVGYYLCSLCAYGWEAGFSGSRGHWKQIALPPRTDKYNCILQPILTLQMQILLNELTSHHPRILVALTASFISFNKKIKLRYELDDAHRGRDFAN